MTTTTRRFAKAWRSAVLAGLIGLLPTVAAAAVRFTLTDGSTFVCDIISLQNNIYTVRRDTGVETVPQASVVSIVNVSPNSTDAAPSSSGPLRLAGSTTIGDALAPALLEAYAARQGGSDINWTQEGAGELALDAKGAHGVVFRAHLSRHGSGRAFEALAAGNADIGMASRRIENNERDRLVGAGHGDLFVPRLENVLALDGLIMLVNKENLVKSLSIQQIRDLFGGRITDWSQVGGPAGPVHLYGRDRESGTADTFKALVMGNTPVTPTMRVLAGADGVTAAVEGDKDGIGYDGFAYLGNTRALTIKTECGLEFVPSDLEVRTEEYPLSRRLHLYLPADATNPQARPFIDFALSDAGQEVARKQNFIDLLPQLAPVDFGRDAIARGFVSLNEDLGAKPEDRTNFADYARHAVNGNRVTTTVRFRYASAALDARAERDIDRLADFLRSSAAAGRKILVAGFADAGGTSLGSRRYSLLRAQNVAELLRGKGVDLQDVFGYGRVAPVACNSTPEGREKNRRVEIWLF